MTDFGPKNARICFLFSYSRNWCFGPYTEEFSGIYPTKTDETSWNQIFFAFIDSKIRPFWPFVPEKRYKNARKTH
jgi:hypothetical protein